ncbi:MAG: hypothetical protein GXY64_09185 [Bacteroidales bacterium]|nr:hypothetical protein [Bacteroidales bacterium]
MKKVRTLYIYVCMLGLATLIGCQDNLYHSSFQDLPQQRWDNQDTISFSIPPSEEDLDVFFTLALRTSSSFKYKDVVMCIDLLEGDSIIYSAPLDVLISDNTRQTHSDFMYHECYSPRHPLRMKSQVSYTVRLTHAMRLNPLERISSVGVFVEKSDSAKR